MYTHPTCGNVNIYYNFLLPLLLFHTNHVPLSKQGQTSKRICIGLPGQDLKYNIWIRESSQLFFVALSRARSRKDFILSKPFRKEYATGKGNHFNQWNKEKARILEMEAHLWGERLASAESTYDKTSVK
jgi:hypothetical protein